MADTNVKIIVDAIDNASNVLKNIGNNLESSLGKQTQSNIGALGGAVEGATGTFGKMALMAGTIGLVVGGIAIGVEKVTQTIGGLLTAASDEARVMALTNSTLKATGDISGMTAEGVRKIALSIEQTTPVSLVAAQSAENMLLVYNNIGHTTLPLATKAVVDMATAMNSGMTPGADQLTEAARRLGLALQDPIGGLSMLSRTGVRFTDGEKALMATMVDSGKVWEAQGVILDKVMGKFGGSSEAQLQTFQGSMDHLKNSFTLVASTIGSALLPAVTYLANALADTLGKAADYVTQHMGQIQAGMTVIAGGIKILASLWMMQWESMAIIVMGVGKAIQAFFSGNFSAIGGIISTTFKSASAVVSDTMGSIANTVGYTVAKATDEWKNGTERQKQATIDAMDGANQAYSNASAKTQKSMRDETETYLKELQKRNDAFQQSLDDMVRSHIDKKNQLVQDLADENSQYAEDMAQRVSDFDDKMLQMESSHEDKVTTIKQQILDEQDSFEQSMKDQLDSFNQTMSNMSDSHESKVTKIQRDLDKERQVGNENNDAKYLDLKQELDDENAAYLKQQAKAESDNAKSIAKIQTDDSKKLTTLQTDLAKENLAYQASVDKEDALEVQQTLKAQEEHDKRVAATQKQLDAENTLLNAHQAEVTQAQKDANDDEITRLEKTHATENADALANHLKKMTDLASQGADEIGAYSDPIITGTDKLAAKLDEQWKEAGKKMEEQFKTSGITAGENLIDGIIEGLKNKVVGLAKNVAWGTLENLPAIGPEVKLLEAIGVIKKQTGGIVPGPIGAPVPILAHGGETVIPQGLSARGSGAGSSITFNVYMGMYAGTETEKRNVAKQLYASLLQLAQSQHKTVADLMGG